MTKQRFANIISIIALTMLILSSVYTIFKINPQPVSTIKSTVKSIIK